MASATTMKLPLLLLASALLAAAALAESAISCGQVTTNLSPCITYLKGASSEGSVPAECCTGIKELNSAATTTPDRQEACKCIKTAAVTISGIRYDLAAALPANCGVDIPYQISPSTDCNSVQ